MKNRAINGLVGVILGAIFSEGFYIGIILTIYGLWLATKVVKEKKEEEKKYRIIAIITMVIGYPLIISLLVRWFIFMFIQI